MVRREARIDRLGYVDVSLKIGSLIQMVLLAALKVGEGKGKGAERALWRAVVKKGRGTEAHMTQSCNAEVTVPKAGDQRLR